MGSINPVTSIVQSFEASIASGGKPAVGKDHSTELSADVIAYEQHPSSVGARTLYNDAAAELLYMEQNGASASQISNLLGAVESIAGSQGISSSDVASSILSDVQHMSGAPTNSTDPLIMALNQIIDQSMRDQSMENNYNPGSTASLQPLPPGGTALGTQIP